MDEGQERKLWTRILRKPCFGNWNCLKESTPDSLEQWRTCTFRNECRLQKAEDMECRIVESGLSFQ